MSDSSDRSGTPEFYDDLDAFIAIGEALLTRGRADRKSPAHTTTLATNGLDGAPRLRTVVLRGFDAKARTARIHTDARTDKVAEITTDARVALHAYHPGEKLQVRLSGRAVVHSGNDVARALWDGMMGFSKRAYYATPAPGHAVSAPTSGIEAAPISGEGEGDAEDAAAFAHFAALVITYESLEVLYLHADGHRRALATWGEGRRDAVWLVP